MFYRLRRWTRHRLWRPLRQTAAIVHPAPLLVAAALGWLFATQGQFQEAYIAYMESPAPLGIAISVVALYLLSAVLYYGNYLLSTIRIDVIYSETDSLQTDWRLRSIRNCVGLLCAALPWIGVAAGLLCAIGRIDGLRSALGSLDESSLGIVGEGLPELDTICVRLHAAMWLAGIGGAVVPLTLHPFHRKVWFRRSVAFLGGLLCFAAALAPLAVELAKRFDREPVIDLTPVYVLAGPLPAAAVIGLFAFAVLGTLAWLSRHTGFPLGAVLAAGMAIAVAVDVPLALASAALGTLLVVLALLAMLSRQRALASLILILAGFAGTTASRPWLESWLDSRRAAAGAPQPVQVISEPAAAFKEWLGKRSDLPVYRAAKQPYPVFIVAVEGGGIYAAAAAAIFLSRLQDGCPNFAQHVFAISAVSGGAIGAAIFESLLSQQEPVPSPGCIESARRQTMEKRAARIILDDHLSPLLGKVIPDLVGLPVDRSRALEESFVRSAERHAFGSWSHARLGAPFVAHWSPENSAPALVLNATSVETGYRVAFAPFTFRGQGDRTLFSFSDLDHGTDPRLSLIQAAVVSARFPGILPAYSLGRPQSETGQRAQINFVDGGYADGSGAETALALYRAVKKIADPAEVDLRVILLTSEAPAPDLNREVGTETRDLIAPIHTLLNVRQLLALKAVTRALAELSPAIGGRGVQQAAPAPEGPPWRAAVVALDHRSVDLPLGWMMSRTTHSVVSLMVGHSERCARDKGKGALAPYHGLLIRENSCVMRAIEELLTPTLR